MKTTSWAWPLAVGVLSVATQIGIFYVRFGRLNTDSTFVDYLLFFFAGALGGLILMYFLNKQTSASTRRVIWIAFIVASPLALILMLAGGLLGWVGILLFPQIPWALFTWLGSLLGK